GESFHTAKSYTYFSSCVVCIKFLRNIHWKYSGCVTIHHSSKLFYP
ncbi:unnamed protein product, partial [Larinioides sclopetarius]